MTQSSDIILAGSKPFLAALLAPLTQRVGVRPRVAGDPQQARTLCQNPVRLLVFEYQGEQWLPLCRELTQSTSGVPVIVAALSPEQTEAQSMLAAAGVGQSPIWSGDTEHLLDAVDRALASGSDTATEAVSEIEEDIPIDEIPVDEEAPPPGHLESKLLDTRPAPPPVVAATKGPPILVRQPPGGPSAAEPSAFSLPPAGRSISEPGSAEPLSIDTHPVEAQPAAPAALVSSEIWPGTVPPAEDAEFLLVSAAGGSLPRAPVFRQVTQKVVGGLTNLDRAALKGEPTPIDPSVLRRASVLRWQVAAAVATTPTAKSQVDAAAVAAFLAGIDGVLADFQEAGEGAPADVLAELDQIRGALVKEAIDFTDAVHRITPNAAPQPAVEEFRKLSAAHPIARAVTFERPKAVQPSKSRGRWIVLALLLTAAGAYHGWKLFSKREMTPTGKIANAPANTFGMARGSGKALTALPGQTVNQVELDQFKATEEAKGNTVKEVAPGTWIVVPGNENTPTGSGGAP